MFKLTEAIFELIVPLVMAAIIDVGIKERNTGYIYKMGGVLLLLAVVGLVCALICQYMGSKASSGIGTQLRSDMYKHISSLSPGELDKIGASVLVTRLTSDINAVQTGVAMLIRLAVRAPFLVVGATVMAMLIDIKLSVIFLFAAPVIGGVLYFIFKKIIPFYTLVQKQLEKLSLVTKENLEGARVIRAFSSEEKETDRFDTENTELYKRCVTVGRVSALLNPATLLIIYLAIIAVLWYGGIRVDTGALMQGQITAFVNYLVQILLALIALANLIVILTKAAASLKRVQEVFDLIPAITDGNGNTEPHTASPLLEFKEVSFSYCEGQNYAVKNISFKINTGETVGIIGSTGSGKSTIINLIPRFYDVSAGEILVNGINIKDYALAELRRKIGIVSQKSQLFSGTIRENIKLGVPDADDEAIKKAMETAQISEKSFKNGLDTHISEGGKNLSGGQKQRLAIARALIMNSEILVFDDSFSALDFATDALLRKALRKETVNKAVFIISQRVSTVRNADNILVIDNGEIAGAGRHDELLESCPIYREICISQQS